MQSKRDTSDQKTHRQKEKGKEKDTHANGSKRIGVPILISNKIDFKRQRHYRRIKESIQQEDIIILNKHLTYKANVNRH